MSGEGDYPSPRAIKGTLIGKRLATDFSSIRYTIEIEMEAIGSQEEPDIGDEVVVS